MKHMTLPLLFLLLSPVTMANVVVYEGDVFPEEVGWQRSTFCTPERWLQDGWLHQDVQVGECIPPPDGDRDSYARSLDEFIGVATFFIEWRVEADGDRSEISGGGPAVLSAWSYAGVEYWFGIARDQVELNRDNLLPIVFVDIEPGVAHTHRLELYGDQLYVWYIDGEIVDSGEPEGAYPPAMNPNITWQGASWYLSSHIRWDYIRYGTIPADGSGDYDTDGQVDSFDFYYFEECFIGPGVDAGPGCRFADFEGGGDGGGVTDGDVDLRDFAAFQNAFTGGEP